MDTGTLVLVLLGAAAIGFLVWPLVRRTPPPALRTQQDTFADALETEKHYVYASIVDLDTDFRAGKVDTAEYQRLRESLLSEAARLLEQLDGVESPSPAHKRA